MKIKTQVIDKIEDVRFGDVAVWGEDRYVASGVSDLGGRILLDHTWWGPFNECTVVRITVEDE